MRRHLASLLMTLSFAGTGFAQPAREVLISSSKNLNLGTVLFDGKDLTPECPTPWSVQLKLQRGGKQEGVQLLTLDNGKMKIVLIPTRGMGILHVTMGDLKLGWNSPVTEVVHPQHINLNLRGGLGWLEGFNEWLARCGLENTGQAGRDEIINNVGDKATVDLTLHGKIANIPASEVEIIAQTTAPYRITIRGVMHEKMLFGPKFELVTEVSTEPGSAKFRIEDKIINKGSQPQEYQILYHYNFGKPLLGEGAKMHVPVRKVTPFNANAATAIKTWNTFAAPKPGYVEQVYLMRPLEDDEGNVKVLLHNPKGNRGVLLKYAKKDLPYLTLWKNTGAEADGYCIGIEPGVSFPNMRKVEREAGRVPKLAGGASHTMRMDFNLLESKLWVDQAALQIAEVQKRQAPIIDTQPENAKGARLEKAKAAEIALKYANKRWPDVAAAAELAIFEKFTVDTKQGWLFAVNTRAAIDTGDIYKAVPIGFGLIMVRNDTGEAYQFATGYSREKIIQMLNDGTAPFNKKDGR